VSILQSFARGITRALGLSPSANRTANGGRGEDAEPRGTIPVERLWLTYKLAAQDVFRDRPLDVWSVRNEGRPGEVFRSVGDVLGILSALALARTDGLEAADGGHDIADTTYIVNAVNGDVVARVVVDAANRTASVVEWIDPKLLDRHRRISRITRAVLNEQARKERERERETA